MKVQINIHKDDQNFGPYSIDQARAYLTSGNLSKEDLACHDGKNWVRLGDIPVFAFEDTDEMGEEPFKDFSSLILPLCCVLIALASVTGFWVSSLYGASVWMSSIVSVITFSSSSLLIRQCSLIRASKILNQPLRNAPQPLVKHLSHDRLTIHSRWDNLTIAGEQILSLRRALFHHAKIDRSFLDSIEDLSPKYKNFASFASKMQGLRSKGGNSWDGELNHLKGKGFGEKIFDAKLNEGDSVFTPAESNNQEGWDGILDGEKIQIKSGRDEQAIREARQKFPDIPVYTTEDHQELAESMDGVVSVDGISAKWIESISEQTMESSAELLDFDLPMITLLSSSAKNLDLIKKGKSDWKTGVENAVIKTAGMRAGAKAGGLLGAKVGGASFGPIGAVAGGAMGSIIGSILGKTGANHINERKLRAAVKNLNEKFGKYGGTYIQALEKKAEHLYSHSASYRNKFSLKSFLIPGIKDLVCKDLRKAHRNWADDCMDQMENLLEESIPEGGEQPDYQVIGRRVLQETTHEPVTNSKLISLRKKVSDALDKVVIEKDKLGMA